MAFIFSSAHKPFVLHEIWLTPQAPEMVFFAVDPCAFDARLFVIGCGLLIWFSGATGFHKSS
jgi:hypothetical protein